MADVFLSYGRATRARVEQISDALEGSGYNLWWDKALNASDDYAMVIEKEIDAARCVVVAWSNQARQSLWVRAEANEALDKGKLVQINLDACRLPLPFTMLHFLDFRPWRGEREGSPWTEFHGRVGGMLRGEAFDDGATGQPGPALQGFGKIALLGWAAILVAALTALAVAMVATGRLAPATFSALTLAALALAAILMALAAFVLIRVSLASRR
ncbi:MAG TPA: toll/interleukin-1 receptor domain-containing protein [Allosphingosinicella sp.]|nr:toll/interleukin-1 receptor domain-containing protein [Allosphingosinicella sp.]